MTKNIKMNNLRLLQPFSNKLEHFDFSIHLCAMPHRMYVTYKTPVSGTPLYHSVVHIGCVAAASVTTGKEQAVFDAIWSKFQSLNIHEVNIVNGKVVQGELLTYYGKDLLDSTHEAEVSTWLTLEDGTQNQTPSLAREIAACGLPTGTGGSGGGILLRYFDGRCGNWAEFMTEMMKVQGIYASVKKVKSVDGYAFKVHPAITGQGHEFDYPRENLWPDHAMVIYNGTIYDHSYGVCYGDVSSALGNFANNIISVGHFVFEGYENSGKIVVTKMEYTTDLTVITTAEKLLKIFWE